MTPQNIAARLCGKLGATQFGRHSLISTVDHRVSDKAYRIKDLLEAVCWESPATLAYDEIAFGVNCSRRMAIRHIQILKALGYVDFKRRSNRRNEYWVPGVTGVRIPTANKSEPQVARMPARKKQRDTSVRGQAAVWARIQDERRRETA